MDQEYKEELNRSQKEDHENTVEWNNEDNSEHESRILKEKHEMQFKMENSHIEKEIKKAILFMQALKNNFWTSLMKACTVKTIGDWK